MSQEVPKKCNLSLEKDFLKHGGLRERMTKARIESWIGIANSLKNHTLCMQNIKEKPEDVKLFIFFIKL
jgi:hypothetical protein